MQKSSEVRGDRLADRADAKRNADIAPARQSSPRLTSPRLSAQQALEELQRSRTHSDTRVEGRRADAYLVMAIPVLAIGVAILLFVYLMA